jgi:metal-responsive CopG/Arc/MetJ family transcriptional regulator
MAAQFLWYDFGMKRAVKVAISLPGDLLHRVDRARRERKVSRSEYFRQAAANLLGFTGDEEVDRYVRGYSNHPETPDEVEAARAASARGLAGEPWE